MRANKHLGIFGLATRARSFHNARRRSASSTLARRRAPVTRVTHCNMAAEILAVGECCRALGALQRLAALRIFAGMGASGMASQRLLVAKSVVADGTAVGGLSRVDSLVHSRGNPRARTSHNDACLVLKMLLLLWMMVQTLLLRLLKVLKLLLRFKMMLLLL
jgi:hypothetical protein